MTDVNTSPLERGSTGLPVSLEDDNHRCPLWHRFYTGSDRYFCGLPRPASKPSGLNPKCSARGCSPKRCQVCETVFLNHSL